MAATKNIIAGSPSAADTLELGVSGGIIQVASGVDLKLLDIGTVVGTGTDQTDAAELIHTVNVTTLADDTVGVILPTAVPGRVVYVYNSVATNGMVIYPGASDSINGGTATTGSIAIEGKTLAKFVALSVSDWMARYTAN